MSSIEPHKTPCGTRRTTGAYVDQHITGSGGMSDLHPIAPQQGGGKINISKSKTTVVVCGFLIKGI